MVAPRTIVIVNPKSQGGKLGKRWTEIAETLGRAFPFDEAITKGPGDATLLTREALRGGAERVVAIGGQIVRHALVRERLANERRTIRSS